MFHSVASYKALFPVLSMLQTTQIELEPNDCIFLVNYLGIHFHLKISQLFLDRKRYGKLARQTVTSANHHKTKYEFNNPKGK